MKLRSVRQPSLPFSAAEGDILQLQRSHLQFRPESHVLLQFPKNFRVWLKGQYPPSGTYPCCHQRTILANIGTHFDCIVPLFNQTRDRLGNDFIENSIEEYVETDVFVGMYSQPGTPRKSQDLFGLGCAPKTLKPPPYLGGPKEI